MKFTRFPSPPPNVVHQPRCCFFFITIKQMLLTSERVAIQPPVCIIRVSQKLDFKRARENLGGKKKLPRTAYFTERAN